MEVATQAATQPDLRATQEDPAGYHVECHPGEEGRCQKPSGASSDRPAASRVHPPSLEAPEPPAATGASSSQSSLMSFPEPLGLLRLSPSSGPLQVPPVSCGTFAGRGRSCNDSLCNIDLSQN